MAHMLVHCLKRKKGNVAYLSGLVVESIANIFVQLELEEKW